MVLMLFIAFMYQGVFSVHGVPGVYGVLLHYRTTGCSFNCLSMSLIIYITAPYSVHTTGCPFYCLLMLLIMFPLLIVLILLGVHSIVKYYLYYRSL